MAQCAIGAKNDIAAKDGRFLRVLQRIFGGVPGIGRRSKREKSASEND